MSYPNTATGFDQRNLLVDKEGVPFDTTNPLPISNALNSFSFIASDIEQRARVNITINDYESTIEANATIDITVVDYESALLSTVTVDGNDLVEGTDFTAETSNDVTATNLASAINDIVGYSATATGAVVTVTYDTAGVAGNAKEASSDSTSIVVGNSGEFSGGLDNATITIDGNTITQGTEWTSETDNDTTATNIATAVSAIAGYEAVAVDNIVTVFYETPGTSGNGKTISKTGSGLTLSASTLTLGGVSYTDVWDYSTSQVGSIEVSLNAIQIDGSGATLSVQHQYSYDNVNWLDGYTFKTLTTEGVENATLNTVGKYSRFKITIGGVNPLIDLSLSGTIKPTQAISQVSESVLVTASDIGSVNDTWKNQGSVIDMRGYTELGLEVTLDVNDSTGNKLQILSGMTSTPVAVLEEATDYQKTLGDTDGVFFYKFVSDGLIPYLQIQTKATLVGATEGTVTIKITKK